MHWRTSIMGYSNYKRFPTLQQPFILRGSLGHLDIGSQNINFERKEDRKTVQGPGAVAQACNPSTLGCQGRWIMRSRDQDHPGQHGETLSLLKIQKISWAWWCMPVVPATQEAEVGELPEPRRRRLWWAKIMPLHSSLGSGNSPASASWVLRLLFFLC